MAISIGIDLKMAKKLGLLLFFLQLWHFGMPNQTIQADTQLNESKTKQTVFISGATNFEIQIGNKFYHVETYSKVTWYRAAHNCRQLGGNLLNIESSKEIDALLSLVPPESYWTSANCLAGNREWISITTGKPMPFLKWHPGEPNNANGNEFCAELKGTALNDANCLWNFSYICEAKIL